MASRIRTSLAIVSLAAAGLALAACGGSAAQPKAAEAATRSCPKAWLTGWQRLANQIGAPVYCPSWMPAPLDAKIGQGFASTKSLDPKTHAYLVSFAHVDSDSGITGEVHVNLRGYPGSTRIPTCEDTLTVKGVTKHTKIPCFADPRFTRRLGGAKVTAYTVNQGADQWHVLYAWRHDGSLYTVSEHVAPPFTYRQVVHNLDRLLHGLVLVRPSG